MKYAVVDIGSNTIKLNIFNADVSQSMFVSQPVGLITYVEDRLMSDAGVTKLIKVLKEYQQITNRSGVDETFHIATACLRNITNQAYVLDTVHERTGITIEVLSGDDEARYSFIGLINNVGSDLSSGIMIDMGGGSTEILGFRNGEATDIISVPIGSLDLYRKFVKDTLPTPDELELIYAHVDKVIEESGINWLADYGDTVYLIGGTARSLERLRGKIQHYDELVYLLGTNLETLEHAVPDRVNTIIPGLAAYCRLLQHMKAHNIVITYAGIREGYLITKLKNI